MKMKRIASLLMVCCFLFLALIACGPKTPTQTNTPTGSAVPSGGTGTGTNDYGDQELLFTVPINELDFEGESVVVLCRDDVVWYREWEKSTVGEDELDQRIAERNNIVESDLNLDMILELQPVSSYDNYLTVFNALIANDVNNDLHEYDIVANFAYGAMQPAVRDFSANLLNKELFPYFNFDMLCWNQAIAKNTIVNNKLFAIAGDINLSMFDKTMLLWCNKDLYDQKKTEDDHPDIQDAAIDGEWYYPDLYRWAQFYEDSSNSQNACEDTYGLGNGTHINDTIPHAWDLELVTRNNDGTFQFNIIGNEKAEEALVNLRSLISSEGYAPRYCTCGKPNGKLGHFADGNYIFYCDELCRNEETNLRIREMESKYCILPMPKYDEFQKNYGTTSSDSYNLITVLNHDESTLPTKGRAVSAFLQHATELSYKDVRGYYFDRVVRSKFFGTNDDDGTVSKSIELFNIIINNVEYALETIYSPLLNDVGWLWRDNVATEGGFGALRTTTLEAAFKENSNSGGSLSKRTQEQYEQSMKEFNRWILQ